MLDNIVLTENETEVNLVFRKELSEKKIFDAISWSLDQFYSSQFLDELADNSVFNRKILVAGYTAYFLGTIGFGDGKKNGDVVNWSYRLLSDYSGKSTGVPDTRNIGLIQLSRNSTESYTLHFGIKDIVNYNMDSGPDDYTSKKHAKKYFDFVKSAMEKCDRKPVLHIIKLETEDLCSLCSEHNYIRKLLLRRLQKYVDKDINFPYILLGDDGLINQESQSTFNRYSIYKSTEGEQAQWLYNCIQKPNPQDITNRLTGVEDNSVRTIVYPTNTNYDGALLLLRRKLGNDRNIIKAELNLASPQKIHTI